ncbi:MAG: hypothetical protein RLZZ387_692 [Chloroflexota bacterium]|jgi:hypothetical protein
MHTTNESTTTNMVILVGTLINASRRRGEREACIVRRGELRAAYAAFGLEIESPFGGTFVVHLEASTRTEGYELLTRSHIEKPVVVEGFIRRLTRTDRRFAVADGDLGARVSVMRVDVVRLREAREDEPVGTSFVRLEGVVNAPPRVSHHRMLTDVDLVRTILQMTYSRTSGYPGSAMTITEPMQVSVVMPLAAEGVGMLWVPGNRVVVEGMIDMNLVPQTRNEAAQTKLAAIDAAWPAQREALEQAVTNQAERERQLRAAVGRYRNQREALSEMPVMSVVSGAVTLLKGRAATEQELRRTVRGTTLGSRRKAQVLTALGLGVTAEDTAERPAEAAPASQRPRRRAGSDTQAPVTIVNMPVAADIEALEVAPVETVPAELAHTSNGVVVEG